MTNPFWERVNALMKKNNLKHKDAAAICHVNSKTFSNWKYKGLYPGIIDGYYLAKFLGVSVEYLVTGKETKPGKIIKEACSLLNKAEQKLKAVIV